MIRSKISRSIVVVIFVVSILFLGFVDIKQIINNNDVVVISNLMKVLFAITLIGLVLLYIYIKDKLYRIKMKRSNSLVIRYIYLAIAEIITSVIALNRNIEIIGISNVIIYIIFTLITSFIIKKVIFNVSKSDILSVIGLLSYSMLPVVCIDTNVLNCSMLLVLFVFSSILVLQILIDELKQKGIKTKKYVILSLILGILIGISTLFGINILVWCIALIILIFITLNLDNTHIDFPKFFVKNVNQTSREKLYAIERININKLFICILFVIGIMLLVNSVGNFVINKISNTLNINFVNLIENINEQNSIIKNDYSIFSLKNIYNNTKAFLLSTKRYNLILIIYILLIELLNVLLKRKYDTKSTSIKSIFVLIVLSISLFNVNPFIFQQLITQLLVLIAIVNTSNIYLNREERIKMLVA